MLIARAGADGLLLGLSKENMQRLSAGDPIRLDLSKFGFPKIHVLIMTGETEQAMFDYLETIGVVGKDAEINITPKYLDEHFR